MSWILFSILAALGWSAANIIDKHVLTKYIKNPLIPTIMLGIIGLLIGSLIFTFRELSYLSNINIILAAIAGAIYALAILLYFKAVYIEEVSRVVPLFFISPIFVAILAAIFLEEIFTFEIYLGIILVVIGAIAISIKNFKKIKLGRAFWLMILSAFMIGAEVTLIKYLLSFADYWTIFSYGRFGAFLVIIPLAYLNFKDLTKTRTKAFGLMSLAETINLLALLSVTIAMAIGFVTLVSAFISVQPFFVLIFAILLSKFYPKLLKEEIGKSKILIKLAAITSILIGASLIT